MKLFYKLRKNNDEHTPKAYGKWFARVKYLETVTLRELAPKMQENCTVKRADILAVLTELSDVLKGELQSGRKVYIEGLGTFKMGLSSRGVDNPRDFRPDRDIVSMHVIFSPEKQRDANGTLRQVMTDGATAIELPEYNINK